MKLEELRKLCEEATPGRWVWRSEGLVNKHIDEWLIIPNPEEWGDSWVDLKNKAFIAALEAELAQVRGGVGHRRGSVKAP